MNFPPTIVNARIAESIHVFYETMEEFFKKKGWKWAPYKRTGDKWIQEDYSIEVRTKYADGAYKELVFTLRRTPGIVGQSSGSKINIGDKHKVSILLPREYPANLAHIKMRLLTPLWHPRISMGRGGDACITVNGEVDRILIDLIYHILMDPKRIRPPKLYPKEDSGLNGIAMRWFEKDAANIHNYMLSQWDKLHEKASLKESGGIRIIGSKKEAVELQKDKQAVRIITHKPEEKEKKPKQKKGGIRII
ncbi:MAG: hypothetical protein ACTSXO_07645 [Candidatus Heimdallarchaeota archaeon]|nr:MAG: hypothetical protein DRO63_00020 [Candidatus Gerdarchaeota archaeon]RLI72490.1 MAG: hypothetical protein DRP02_01425 [Candidatus Gerdarchaeota archaeon]RLI74267.1 MAG: hypothetical protein DRO91_00955 [Candidatus Heimdallarchaeota archaeon]